MLAAPVIVSWYYYGANALRLMLAGAVSAVLFELIALTAMKRDRRSMLDLHAVFTGLAVAMMLPATANTALVVAGTAFAIFVVKIPFGSALKTPFVPAAAAMAFLTLCFPGEVFLFPSLETAAAEFEPGVSLAAMLKAGSSYHMNTLRVLSVISGNVAGPMGTGCAVGKLCFLRFYKTAEALQCRGLCCRVRRSCTAFPERSVRKNDLSYDRAVRGYTAVLGGVLCDRPRNITEKTRLAVYIRRVCRRGVHASALFRRVRGCELLWHFARERLLAYNQQCPQKGGRISPCEKDGTEKTGTAKRKECRRCAGR